MMRMIYFCILFYSKITKKGDFSGLRFLGGRRFTKFKLIFAEYESISYHYYYQKHGGFLVFAFAIFMKTGPLSSCELLLSNHDHYDFTKAFPAENMYKLSSLGFFFVNFRANFIVGR